MLEYLPAGHSSQAAEPLVAENLPAAQRLHADSDVCRCEAENFPTAHGVHAASPEAAKLPAGQVTQASRPVPPTAEEVPLGQNVHADEASAAYLPASQATQDAAPAAGAILPALHAEQAPAVLAE